MTIVKPKVRDLLSLAQREGERIVWILGGDPTLCAKSAIRVVDATEGPARPVHLHEPSRTAVLGALLFMRHSVQT